MSRNYGKEVSGEVGTTLLPVVVASGPLLGFCGFVCVLGIGVYLIQGAFSALTGSAEGLDVYVQHKPTELLFLVLMLPAFVALPIASKLVGDLWTPSHRKTKIFGLLLAIMWLVVTTISTINGSQIWSQLIFHLDGTKADKSLMMTQNCPLEVAKPGYDRIAHDSNNRYSLFRCDNYLSDAQLSDVCWREYRTMKPVEWSACGSRRRQLTGLNWPIKDPVVIPGEPREVYATETQMRAVLAKKGLSPL